jgi:dihydroneopterin aldolase
VRYLPLTVVKLGGSHACSPLLRPWLAAIGAAEAPLVVVPGGGPFADAVRAAQPVMGFDDRAAHLMALMAMTQYGTALAALAPRLALAETEAAIGALLRAGRVPVIAAWPMLREEAALAPSWDVTSDTIALWLARRLGANRLVLVKRHAAPAGADAASLTAQGIVDAAFPGMLAGYAGSVTIAGPDDMATALAPAA